MSLCSQALWSKSSFFRRRFRWSILLSVCLPLLAPLISFFQNILGLRISRNMWHFMCNEFQICNAATLLSWWRPSLFKHNTRNNASCQESIRNSWNIGLSTRLGSDTATTLSWRAYTSSDKRSSFDDIALATISD